MNSSKNKLNSEIILIFHFNPNAYLVLGLFNKQAESKQKNLFMKKLMSYKV